VSLVGLCEGGGCGSRMQQLSQKLVGGWVGGCVCSRWVRMFEEVGGNIGLTGLLL
jgi:hypothetical protein